MRSPLSDHVRNDKTMKGADALVQASAASGLEVCFANPGTTEMAMVEALRQSTEVRSVLALFEGVASGAADGYARMAGKPASVMLHLGPGLGNATANLHNARRGQSPVVNWVGDHTTWLLPHDPPLSSDIDAIARGTSRWIRTNKSVDALPGDAVDAIAGAFGPISGVATLILPADFLEATLPDGVELPKQKAAGPAPNAVDDAVLEGIAKKLRDAKNPLVLLGGPATGKAALLAGGGIAEATGGKLLFEQFPRCVRREPGVPSPDKMGYIPFQARAQLADHDVILSAGAGVPVCFFGYPGESPLLAPESAEVIDLAEGGADVCRSLSAIASLVDAQAPKNVPERAVIGDVSGHLQPQTVCAALARALPDDAVVVDEGITSSLALYPALTGAAPHEYLSCKGGSIGWGTPAATGAAIGAPGRRVVCYVGDGSAAYTIQSLWTQAREGLDVTTIVMVNRTYAVLQMELMRSGAPVEGAGKQMTEIGGPDQDFVALAKGWGVPAREVRDVDALAKALEESFSTPGPMLIAAVFGS